MANYRLAHPLYLDVQMMVSFLAYLEGGVYVSREETLQKERLRDGKGAQVGVAQLPSLGALLGIEATLSAEAGVHIGETAETRVARHHTAASLFNGLYGFLREDGAITPLNTKEQLAQVATGDFVELSGRYTGNPLEQTLAVFSQVLAYMEDMADVAEGAKAQRSSSKKSGNPQVRESVSVEGDGQWAGIVEGFQRINRSIEMRILRKMKDELEASPIHDVVLETSAGVKAVLTVASDYYDGAVAERLSSGDFVVLGKVTRILREGESIDLSRRTVMGKMADEGESFTSSITNLPGLNLQVGDPVVRFPAVQVLPMAIFV
ncbi:hypothetical protein ACFWZZ_31175 [[Kitasatospora] papulosa]|uniref:Uncharacterized protein n=1 Tax=Streptomyces sp. NBC_00148 TaxID=2903626 RepID=A0AAU1LUN1_9ACTN